MLKHQKSIICEISSWKLLSPFSHDLLLQFPLLSVATLSSLLPPLHHANTHHFCRGSYNDNNNERDDTRQWWPRRKGTVVRRAKTYVFIFFKPIIQLINTISIISLAHHHIFNPENEQNTCFGGSGHHLSATTTPKMCIKTHFRVLIFLCLPLPSQPRKRARLLIFWVLAIIYLLPQPWKQAQRLIFGVPILLWPPLPSQPWKQAQLLIFRVGNFSHVFCVWTVLLPLYLTPTQTQ